MIVTAYLTQNKSHNRLVYKKTFVSSATAKEAIRFVTNEFNLDCDITIKKTDKASWEYQNPEHLTDLGLGYWESYKEN